ncbi:hypothetical protein KEU06_18160 [Pseudaminobacter sp. 19-2017]|uniref:Lipoprotein n=1 Tax=Pseudaminobacter soli (ex Zhang et al. 2022) TaxID=2831468 RepID=A0A942DYH1_9HYPH|nr:hypothetical protein [Pseudaminobacter soli]MBS3650544.1 hypothetical protein [Pseudaminobacter soli]
MRKLFFTSAFASVVAGCTTPPTPSADPAAALAASRVNAAAATNVGAGSRPGFCTFKDPSGKLFEKKC